MKNLWILGLIVGLGVGYFTYPMISGDSNKNEMADMEMDNEMSEVHTHADGTSHSHASQDHDEYLVPEDQPAPEVMLEVLPDAKQGWNIHLMTENFKFSPENASSDHVDGEGHAHIYVDGEKISRVYGNWFYMDSLGDGDHMIRVTLNTNDHRGYATSEGVIEASATFTE